jgi:hypothetical protein
LAFDCPFGFLAGDFEEDPGRDVRTVPAGASPHIPNFHAPART